MNNALTNDQIEELNYTGYLYEQSPIQPDWYDHAEPMCESATSGTSPFNEWYRFKNRAAALKVISETFRRQNFIDTFTEVDGEFYNMDDLKWDDESKSFQVGDAKPAHLGEMVWANSQF